MGFATKNQKIYIFVSMQLNTYISDLLYRYECVIVPGFGGFVSNTIPSRANHFTHTFYPPTKKLGFNSQLTNNDGLLANYIASSENCSFEAAVDRIEIAVIEWKSQLEKEAVTLEKIGTLSLNRERKIIFSPIESINYLTSSYGLANVQSPAIKRLEYKQKTVALETTERRRSPRYLKYAAAVAAMLTIGSLSWNSHMQNQANILEKEAQEIVSKKIQEATFTIANPLPEINLDLVKAQPKKKYHLIAGAFSEKANAAKKIKQLQKRGFNARVIGINKWGLTQVSFESYGTREEAVKQLQIIKRNIDKEAWLYIK